MKQIKKLDVLQKDLDKLKCLNELPEMLKSSIDEYYKAKKERDPQMAGQIASQEGVQEERDPVNI